MISSPVMNEPASLASNNVAPLVSTKHRLAGPPVFNYERLAHPPATFRQEKLKTDVRLPAAPTSVTGPPEWRS